MTKQQQQDLEYIYKLSLEAEKNGQVHLIAHSAYQRLVKSLNEKTEIEEKETKTEKTKDKAKKA